ncbi:MAG: amidohydrolase family protein [Gammaproteobacteria bacterium]
MSLINWANRLTLALVCAGVAQVGLARTVIHAGTLIDGAADTARSDVTIVVDGSQIVSVTDGFVPPERGDRLVDLSEFTVLPGLMDMHTHLSSQQSKSAYLDRFRKSEADVALFAAHNARLTLQAGFTTVRDLGDSYNATVALRNAINAGLSAGPRILTAAKAIGTTGGHADPTNGVRADLRGNPGPAQGVINGPEDAAKAVRQRYKDGADLIKITATGGVLSVAKNGQNPQFTVAELTALVAAATDYGFHVAAHAHGKQGMKRAIEAGVRSIEHGTYMDDEIMRLMRRKGTYYVPTITAGRWVGDKAKIDGFFPEVVRSKAAAIGPLIQDTFARAHKAGVNIVFGTDSGVSEHGYNAQEFLYMVEAGMSPMESIKSATSVAATFLELSDLGVVAPQKTADLIAVVGDPLEDISVLQRVEFVMKEGVVHHKP